MIRENRAARLREKLDKRQLIIGAHTFYSDPQISEALGCHGFEFVWIDGEHAAFDRAELLGHIMGCAAGNTASFVRVAWNDPVLIKPVLEMGPDGIILPMVSTKAQAEAAVAACRYPPSGIRGFGPRRAIQYGALGAGAYLEDVDSRLMRMVQIEHVEAVDNLQQILSVPGLDLVIVGPNDLSGSMGLLGQLRHPEVTKQFERIADTCRRAGKPFGVSVGAGDPAFIREWAARGAALIGCGDDISYISMGAKATMALARSMGYQG